jgi:hypothetical protein
VTVGNLYIKHLHLMLDRGSIRYGYTGDTIILEKLGYDTVGMPQSID